jgi:hypothetical protein
MQSESEQIKGWENGVPCIGYITFSMANGGCGHFQLKALRHFKPSSQPTIDSESPFVFG